MHTLLRLSFVVIVMALPSVAQARDCLVETPVPEDAQVIGPSDGVPENLARFSGVWSGTWKDHGRDALCSTLVVLEIQPDGSAAVVYSWGTWEQWLIDHAGYQLAEGSIKGKKLRFTISNGAKVAYKIKGSGEKLKATYTRNGRVTSGSFVHRSSE